MIITLWSNHITISCLDMNKWIRRNEKDLYIVLLMEHENWEWIESLSHLLSFGHGYHFNLSPFFYLFLIPYVGTFPTFTFY